MSSPMFFSQALKYYKQEAVQEALLEHARDREVSVRYGDSFGKRPDVITYPADVLSFATKKVTSFHCSEERWRDPLAIETGMNRRALDELRIGWDLVLDIDCPDWAFSKLTTHLLIKAIAAHGIESITCKFSGGKGFHIGVPFEAFPEEYGGRAMKDLFPEAPRAIAEYLLRYIGDTKNGFLELRDRSVVFLPGADAIEYSFDDLEALVPEGKKLFSKVCPECENPWRDPEKKTASFCPACQAPVPEGALRCARCSYVITQRDAGVDAPAHGCARCGASTVPMTRFDVSAIIEVDTILLASRHLFRMPYSLHEKHGLVSVPVSVDGVLSFEKEDARPENVSYDRAFLSRDARPGEASRLLALALRLDSQERQEASAARKEYDAPEDAIPEELFPPCMRLILGGLEDGKKRALFILTNFLKSAGWSDAMIRDRVYEWNEQNPEHLREVVIKGHLQLKEKKKEVIPPPNCTSDYYMALGVCKPDSLCKTIKNPAQYAMKKYRLENPHKKKREKLTEEQKAMRKEYRERKKHEDDQDQKQKG